MAKRISLQSKLIKNALLSSVIAGLIAWLGLIVVSSYQTMQLHDEFMQEISEFLTGDVNQARDTQIDELSEEFEIQYALYLNGKILTQSDDQTYHHPIQAQKNGYRFEYKDGRLLRIYTAQSDQLQVNVVQPISIRFEDVWQSILSFGLLLLFLWLIQLIMLYVLVKRQLKPLNDISQAISAKSATDLSPIQNTEPQVQELEPIVQQLNRMLSRVDQALQAEQRFTADASHELRSPLSAINLRLQVLQRKYQDQTALKQDLNTIQTDVNRGTQVLENLLLLAQLDPTEQLTEQKQTVDLEQITIEILNDFESLIQKKNIQIHLHLNHMQIQAHKDFMVIALRNFIENALKYTPVNGDVYLQAGNNQIGQYLQIENSGEGLSEDVISRLGERFYRVLGTQTQGSGLGLSIAKKIIDLHHAKLSIAASEHGGLNIHIQF
ncbi:two-component sensor histidine kinase [Acinetobacter sp. NCu2D-2]|uniref:ATP-binding protein n=1 Tax=Acinetobacter sp. NCu2D-2 TaxID=1608473 RepID=UPI0007CDB21D|nr:ATP-binding protein [Acinetobacter sp. NCu2D-2]ANF82085.1 two-component sensor histidine kinase [Acinetobacter sp. NCu2D-2]